MNSTSGASGRQTAGSRRPIRHVLAVTCCTISRSAQVRLDLGSRDHIDRPAGAAVPQNCGAGWRALDPLKQADSLARSAMSYWVP